MKRGVRAVTDASLRSAASHYLERYPTTAQGLRRVLARRVAKARILDTPVIDGVDEVIEAIVAKYVDAGVVDDRAFSRTKALSLHRRGTSTRMMRHRLRRAGVDDETLDEAMAGLDAELHASPAEREMQAAAALARRRRLGPFRDAAQRAVHRSRDLASLARAGFGCDVARKIVDAPSPDALDGP